MLKGWELQAVVGGEVARIQPWLMARTLGRRHSIKIIRFLRIVSFQKGYLAGKGGVKIPKYMVSFAHLLSHLWCLKCCWDRALWSFQNKHKHRQNSIACKSQEMNIKLPSASLHTNSKHKVRFHFKPIWETAPNSAFSSLFPPPSPPLLLYWNRSSSGLWNLSYLLSFQFMSH